MTGRHPTAVTFVHGWLDSGADELAVRLATSAAPDAVLVHPDQWAPSPPPGIEAVPTRETIGFRTAGCACCAQRVDLIDTLGRIARRRRPPSHIVVLELAGADPATPVVTVLDDPDLTRLVRLNAVVLALDGPATATAVGTNLSPFPSEQLLEAAIMADAVWISRGRKLTPRGVQAVAAAVRGVNPLAPLDATSEPDLAHVLGSASWSPSSVPARLRHLRLPPECGTSPPPVDGARTGSMIFSVAGALDAERLDDWVHALHGAAGERLLRIEGVLSLAGQDRRLLVVGTRTAVRCEPGPPWRQDEPRVSWLRIAGRELELGDLGSTLLACRP